MQPKNYKQTNPLYRSLFVFQPICSDLGTSESPSVPCYCIALDLLVNPATTTSLAFSTYCPSLPLGSLLLLSSLFSSCWPPATLGSLSLLHRHTILFSAYPFSLLLINSESFTLFFPLLLLHSFFLSLLCLEFLCFLFKLSLFFDYIICVQNQKESTWKMDYRKMHFPTENYIFILKSIAERKAIKENLSKASVSV